MTSRTTYYYKNPQNYHRRNLLTTMNSCLSISAEPSVSNIRNAKAGEKSETQNGERKESRSERHPTYIES